MNVSLSPRMHISDYKLYNCFYLNIFFNSDEFSGKCSVEKSSMLENNNNIQYRFGISHRGRHLLQIFSNFSAFSFMAKLQIENLETNRSGQDFYSCPENFPKLHIPTLELQLNSNRKSLTKKYIFNLRTFWTL